MQRNLLNFEILMLQICEGCECLSYLCNKGYFLNEIFIIIIIIMQVLVNSIYFFYDVVDEYGISVIDKFEIIQSVVYDFCGI